MTEGQAFGSTGTIPLLEGLNRALPMRVPSWPLDHVGVIAWSRTGNPDLGDWGPPEVLVRTGIIPDEFEAGGGVE